ncbi:hypothetical protein HPE39_17495 [Escherichia coli]|nr:hypothetical protein [Escherichia coli]QKP98229.1 hypothetical protein HPE39_17495 [Escherichia coli]
MRKIFLPLLLVALSPVAHSEGVQEVEIDAPLSGWHPAEGEDASFHNRSITRRRPSTWQMIKISQRRSAAK